MSNRHFIGKVSFDARLPAAVGDAFALQQAVDKVLKERLLPALEAAFDRLAGPGEVIALDSLDVDILDLPARNWQDALAERLVEAVETAVRRRLEDAAPGQRAERKSLSFSRFESWIWFLKNGHLPLGGPQPPESEWLEAVLESVAAQPAAVDSLARTLVSDTALRRLLGQHDGAFLEKLAAAFAGATGAELNRLRLELTQILTQAPAKTSRHYRYSKSPVQNPKPILAGLGGLGDFLKTHFWPTAWQAVLLPKKQFDVMFFLEEIFSKALTNSDLQAVLQEMKRRAEAAPAGRFPMLKSISGPVPQPGQAAGNRPSENPGAFREPKNPLLAAPKPSGGGAENPLPQGADAASENWSAKNPGVFQEPKNPLLAAPKPSGGGAENPLPQGADAASENWSAKNPGVFQEPKNPLSVAPKPSDGDAEKPLPQSADAASENRSAKTPEVFQWPKNPLLVAPKPSDSDAEKPLPQSGDEAPEIWAKKSPGEFFDLKLPENQPLAPVSERPIAFRPAVGTASEPAFWYVGQAGLVLLHPFLPAFFRACGLLDGERFADENAAQRAVHLAHFLATGQADAPEYEQLMAKFLCGWPFEKPLDRAADLAETERAEAQKLLETVIRYWSKLGATSPDALRGTFLDRPGKLTRTAFDGWKLQVEQSGLDVLLGFLPWGFSMVKLPWMGELLQVEWTY